MGILVMTLISMLMLNLYISPLDSQEKSVSLKSRIHLQVFKGIALLHGSLLYLFKMNISEKGLGVGVGFRTFTLDISIINKYEKRLKIYVKSIHNSNFMVLE
jgi:hypothetical protein